MMILIVLIITINEMIMNVSDDTDSIDANDTALIINSRPIVEIKRQMLEEMWKKAVPLKDVRKDERSFAFAAQNTDQMNKKQRIL